MAKKDEIFISFINHPVIKEKYGIKESELPLNLVGGVNSEHVIIQTIALIVESLEKIHPDSDKALDTKIRQFLQKEAI
jgi:hypothetical protein